MELLQHGPTQVPGRRDAQAIAAGAPPVKEPVPQDECATCRAGCRGGSQGAQLGVGREGGANGRSEVSV